PGVSAANPARAVPVARAVLPEQVESLASPVCRANPANPGTPAEIAKQNQPARLACRSEVSRTRRAGPNDPR
ncbi:MAG: hypothetical protein WA942_20285, partial [Mycolicibacter sinensis]